MNNLTKLTLTLLAACTAVPMLLGQTAANRNTSAQSTQQQAQPTRQAAQQEQQPYSMRNLESNIFIIKHRDPNELLKIIKVLGSNSPLAAMQANEMQEIKTITVRDYSENIRVIMDAIKILDVPVAAVENVELQLRVDIIWASTRTFVGDPVPSNLSDVVSALSKTLSYTQFRQGATYTLRSKGQGINYVTGKLKWPNSEDDVTLDSSCYFNSQNFVKETGVLHSQFIFTYNTSRINSDISLKNGEKIVVGTTLVGDIAMVAVVSMEKIR